MSIYYVASRYGDYNTRQYILSTTEEPLLHRCSILTFSRPVHLHIGRKIIGPIPPRKSDPRELPTFTVRRS